MCARPKFDAAKVYSARPSADAETNFKECNTNKNQFFIVLTTLCNNWHKCRVFRFIELLNNCITVKSQSCKSFLAHWNNVLSDSILRNYFQGEAVVTGIVNTIWIILNIWVKLFSIVYWSSFHAVE